MTYAEADKLLRQPDTKWQLAIYGSNIVLYKFVPQADWLEVFAYLTAGPLAIVASMVCHERWMKK